MKEKTLGEVARERYLQLGDLDDVARWQALVESVIAEHARRKEASLRPTTTEIGLWLSGRFTAARNTYSRRTGRSIEESYAALDEVTSRL